MKRYVSFPLKSGEGVVVAEVAELAGPQGDEPAALPDAVAGTAAESFEAALAKVKPIARAVIASLADAAEGVTGLEVEFSLKLNAEAGVLLACGGVEANFKVALKWERS